MPVIQFSGLYSVALCRQFPDHLFVFGDNTRRFGKGGQAIIRTEPNVFGVPTKRFPSMDRSAFFRENEADALPAILDALEELWKIVESDRHVVIPFTDDGKVSLGLGLAKLNELAPSLYGTIELHVEEMCSAHGESYGSITDILTVAPADHCRVGRP